MKIGYRWLLALLVALSVAGSLLPTAPALHAQSPSGDWPIPGGRFYTQAAGGMGGFSVVDDGEARFWSEFQRLGGLQTVGYPISQRFRYDGFVTQAFQKLVLQWRPEVGQAWPVNVFDELSKRGFDLVLRTNRQTPSPLIDFDKPGQSWETIVANRWALLNTNQAIRTRYFQVGDPLTVFGLPTSEVMDMGNHYAVRTQRAVFQQWKENVPWASRGQVTIANGGDIAKELGWLSGSALTPEPGPGTGPRPVPTVAPSPTATPSATSWIVRSMAIGPGAPARHYLLQQQVGGGTAQRLLVSDDLGATWQPFSGGLPFGEGCVHNITMDHSTSDALYLTTCQGFYRWTGARWERVAAQGDSVTPGQPNQLWAISNSSSILLSNDGGTTWGEAAANLNGGTFGHGIPGSVIVDTRTGTTAFAMLSIGRSGTTILRAAPGGMWQPFTEPEALAMHPYSVVLDRSSGKLFIAAPARQEIWRIPNPSELDVSKVRWELASTLNANQTNMILLAAGWSPSGSLLYATRYDPSTRWTNDLLRSLDGGITWEPVRLP